MAPRRGTRRDDSSICSCRSGAVRLLTSGQTESSERRILVMFTLDSMDGATHVSSVSSLVKSTSDHLVSCLLGDSKFS